MSLLGEIFTQLLGEAVGDALGSGKHRQPFPEGETNASLGAASAFFAVIGFLLALPAAMIAVLAGPTLGIGMGVVSVLALLGLAASYAALQFGRKGLRVTRRNIVLIKFGVVLALPGMLLSVAALVASAFRVFL